MHQQPCNCETYTCTHYFIPLGEWCVACLAHGWNQGNDVGQEHKTDRLQEAIALVEDEEPWNAFLDELLKSPESQESQEQRR